MKPLRSVLIAVGRDCKSKLAYTDRRQLAMPENATVSNLFVLIKIVR